MQINCTDATVQGLIIFALIRSGKNGQVKIRFRNGKGFFSTTTVVCCNQTSEAPSYSAKVCCSYHIKLYRENVGGWLVRIKNLCWLAFLAEASKKYTPYSESIAKIIEISPKGASLNQSSFGMIVS